MKQRRLATAQTLERLACNDMTYINPEACGEAEDGAFIDQAEYAQKDAYNFNKTLMVSSLVVTTIASSVFGATFLF